MRSRSLLLIVWGSTALILLAAAGLSLFADNLGLGLAFTAAGLVGVLVATHLKFAQIGRNVRREAIRLENTVTSSAAATQADLEAHSKSEDLEVHVERAILRALASHDSILLAELAALRKRMSALEARIQPSGTEST